MPFPRLPTCVVYTILEYMPHLGITTDMLQEGIVRLKKPLFDRTVYRQLRPLCNRCLPEYGMFVVSEETLELLMRYTSPQQGLMWPIATEYIGAGYHRILYSDGERFRVAIKG